jgi:PAS domain S-box-containing protein
MRTNASTGRAAEAARIMIVEDERIVAMDLAQTLGELGYDVAGMATRGEEAIELARRLSPQLILMDVRLAGEIDGITAAQAIRHERDVPVVYLTAHSDSETLRRAARSDASAYLVKPFKSPELRCVIEIALHKHAMDVRLRENEQWLATTLQSLTEAVIATDVSGHVRLLNVAAEQLTGWSRSEAAQRTIEEVLAIVDERSGTPLENPVRTALKLRTPVAIIEGSALISRGGGTVSVEESAAPIVDTYGRLLGSVLVVRDVTERREQLQQIQKLNAELEQRVAERTAALEAANQELEAFSYSVAHDLRAPLRGIDSFSQLLLERYSQRLDGEGLAYLNRVRAAVARMSQLIDALLSLAQIGRRHFQPLDFDFSQLVRAVAAEVAASHPGRNVTVQIAPDMRARADARLLRVVMANLLENAWKFTARRPEALIEVGRLEEAPVPTYYVRDNGAGFDPTHAQKLFGAFQRLHTEKEFPGTGIGLAIVQRVICRHGGTVWAQSQPAQGATFYFTLPALMH